MRQECTQHVSPTILWVEVSESRYVREQEKRKKKKGQSPHSEMSSLTGPVLGAEGTVMHVAAVTQVSTEYE